MLRLKILPVVPTALATAGLAGCAMHRSGALTFNTTTFDPEHRFDSTQVGNHVPAHVPDGVGPASSEIPSGSGVLDYQPLLVTIQLKLRCVGS